MHILLRNLTLCVLMICSCNIIKTVRILKKGKTGQEHFKEVIPFETRAGLIIVEVELKGKKYHFIFDSGATNAVSKEIADELHLVPVLDQTAEDGEGTKNGIKFAMLDTVKLGKSTFLQTAAAIVDLKQVAEIACLHVDGLIGANLMRTAKWQIDYMRQELIVTDNISNLDIPKDAFVFPFSPMLSGTPVIETLVCGVKCRNNIFDLGSTGTIVLSEDARKKLVAAGCQFPCVRGIGSNSSGLYGMVYDTSYTGRLDKISVGTFTLENYVVDFKRNKNGNFGSGLFKDYIVTMDWDQGKIFFQPQPVVNKEAWSTFGFVPVVKDKKFIVSFLYDDSPAKEAGLLLGDRVISINGKDYTNISTKEYCEMIRGNGPWKKEDIMKLIVRPANGGPDKEMQLQKRDILKK